MVGAQLATRLFYPRFGPRRLVAAGLVGVASAMSLMTTVGFDTNLWWMRVLMFVMGMAMSQVFISCQAASFATISHADTGYASSLFNSQRQLGSALGVAVLATVLAAVGTTHVVGGQEVANLAAYHAAFLAGAAIALLGAAVALTINDADAAATMVRRRPGRGKAEPDPASATTAAAGEPVTGSPVGPVGPVDSSTQGAS